MLCSDSPFPTYLVQILISFSTCITFYIDVFKIILFAVVLQGTAQSSCLLRLISKMLGPIIPICTLCPNVLHNSPMPTYRYVEEGSE